MTEITDAQVAEIQWASSEQGRAALRAAWDKAKRLGLDKPSGHDLDMAGVSAIIYAAYLAAGWDAGPGEPFAHTCHWQVRGTQGDLSFNPTGGHSAGGARTIALLRCEECGDVKTVTLTGTWSRASVDGTTL